MAILNWILSKATGRATVGENCEKVVNRVIQQAGLSKCDLKMYRAEKSTTNSYFLCRYYVGEAVVTNQTKGIIIDIDENTGYPILSICEKSLVKCRDAVYEQYKKDCRKDNSPGTNEQIIPRMLRSYYMDDNITGKIKKMDDFSSSSIN
jgi:hypothetical protein